jgi:polyphosphate glucokinase
MITTENDNKILSIDIGGSNIKAILLDETAAVLKRFEKLPTPVPATPEKVLEVIKQLAQKFEGYTKIATGFPGYVKDGVVKTAPNLGTEQWMNFDLQKKLQVVLGKPAIVINDADLQGLSVVSGKGIEMMITLGTGFGSALLRDGILMPHLEIAHHPITRKKTYDQYVGQAELTRIGEKKWNNRMKKIIKILQVVFNYDRLYISGGNADLIKFKLENNITIATNKDGIKGGAKLWPRVAQQLPLS